MAALRFLAALMALAAVLALVADLTPKITGDGAFHATTFEEHWRDLSPKTLQGAEETLSRSTSPTVWTVLRRSVLALPTFVLFFLMAALLGYAGRHRNRVNIYVN